MSAGRIGTRVVVTATPSETILEVAQRMAEQDVGCVVVVDLENKPVGILTDRDVTTRAVAKELDPSKTRVSEVMSENLLTVDESTPIEQVVAKMGNARTRRLVIVGTEAKLVGIISVDDILELLAEEATSIGRLLRQAAPPLATPA